MSPGKRSSSFKNIRKAADEPTLLAVLWPIVLGIAITFLTLRVADVAALLGQIQFATLYPWVALVKLPILGIQYESAVMIGQYLLYLQYPLYGLIAGIVLYKSNSIARGFFTVFSLHLFALIVFIGLSIIRPS